MLQIPTYTVAIVFILIHAIDAQPDPNICPDGLSPAIQDPRWRTIPQRFEIMGELVASDGMIEVSQAFSSSRDAIAGNSRSQFEFYWNFLTNEKFTVVHATAGSQTISKCLREVILPQSETSVIVKDTLTLKPSIILGFDARNQRNVNWGLRYVGDGELRGIPTNQFKSCFFVNDIKATVAVTYHVSDVNKFQAYLPINQSIILQLDIDISSPSKSREQYQYNVFRYTPNPSRREERQALETPEGLYCEGRNQTLPVPSNIPERASSNAEIYIPTLNSTIFSTHSLYDTEFQFTRADAWFPDIAGGGPSWYHMTELHDFAVGLSYQYNHTNHQCRVSDINPGSNDAVTVDGSPNLFQMSTAQHLFLMDDITYQYTGEKRCRDRVWCHVWIGEKSMPNNTVEHREWYWASSVNDVPLPQYIPMKLIVKQMRSDIPFSVLELSVFNFERSTNIVFDIDYTMADCYRAMGPEEDFNLGVISFTVANDQQYPVQKNIDYLRYKIWETLIFVLGVRPIRISHIIVDHDGKDLPVTFTLLDAPPRLGPVEFPLKETSLTTAIERLRSVINANGLAFRAKYDTKEVILRARINSLQVITTSFDQNAPQCVNQTFVPTSTTPQLCPDTTTTTDQNPNLDQNIEIVYQSSGPLVTGLWIGFIILGLLIGIVSGFFALKRLSKR